MVSDPSMVSDQLSPIGSGGVAHHLLRLLGGLSAARGLASGVVLPQRCGGEGRLCGCCGAKELSVQMASIAIKMQWM